MLVLVVVVIVVVVGVGVGVGNSFGVSAFDVGLTDRIVVRGIVDFSSWSSS